MSVDSIFTGPGPDARFRENLAQGRFCLQYCRDSERYFFYPRPLSPETGSADWEWREVGGRGTVYSTTVIRRRAEQGGPYNLALIELAEGPRILSRVEGIPPQDVTIGMSVRAKIIDQDDTPMLVFEPSGEISR